jgi:hypothetical protein
VVVRGGEFESAAGACVAIVNKSLSGAVTGGSINIGVDDAQLIPTAGQACIDCTGTAAPSVGNLTLANNYFGNSTGYKLKGMAYVNKLAAVGNFSAGGSYQDTACGILSNDDNQNSSYLTGAGFTTPLPGISAATPGTLAVTYTTQEATWQKQGKFLTFQFNIVISVLTLGTASGALLITGLPSFFPPVAAAPSGGALIIPGQLGAQLEVLDASGNIYAISAAGAQIAITTLTGTPTLRGTITYQVAG